MSVILGKPKSCKWVNCFSEQKISSTEQKISFNEQRATRKTSARRRYILLGGQTFRPKLPRTLD